MDLFDSLDVEPREERLGPGAVVLRNLARDRAAAILAAIDPVLAAAPLRRMITPGGSPMSVRMSNCGALGWTSDRRGYRYVERDPLDGRAWPPMPDLVREIGRDAAARAGFPGFEADACLINCYEPGARMSLHQDRDERDFGAPIVSVSLGLPAVFLFGGPVRKDKPLAIPLRHGDVIVWGGPARLHFHGVRPLQDGEHPLTGHFRYNLTLRKAG
ncbi:DNA oxidative demethylase AlkB [Dokdonella immobilis]|uniref:DNA-N1-methyladenine dioxygenase n=1 Tax=Dokdonella immobilis TaxID=578942 RepID=A0A1I4Z3C4_9GAMM|nr:DNA oxidative demethylase AlkB [Dokdonella immobilis]SFN44479.1 DNA-N1-methyladenine dioxygenase [Dokdonella immobilis]